MIKTYLTLILCLLASASCKNLSETSFRSNWNSPEARTWIGPEYWSNPMQDWHVEKGRLICDVAGPGRSVHLLTHSLTGTDGGGFRTRVNVGFNGNTQNESAEGWVGYIIGAKGEFNDYRDAAVYGKGINAGVTLNGHLFIGKIPAEKNSSAGPLADEIKGDEGISLLLEAGDVLNDSVNVRLSALKKGTSKLLEEIRAQVPLSEIRGNIALVSHIITPQPAEGAWFEKWEASGDILGYFPERRFGPVMFTLYTLNKGILKLTAQMPPVAGSDERTVNLEVSTGENNWEKAAAAEIDPMARTATFRIENFDDKKDTRYRVSYAWSPDGNNPDQWYYEGVIRKNPVDKEEIVVAAFTGNNDLGFPNNEITDHVLKHKPDLLVYTGDQIYEPRGGFGHTIEPLETATIDYLRKWYMFGWEYGEMLRNIPSVCLPDDHDVYHGNLWGAGGKAAKRSDDVKEWQDDGGYKMPAVWVNMVQRTQTSHMPDSPDPSPVLQDISVYYTDLRLGGISFAVIEDRKWKSAPRKFLPESLKVINGWAESSRLVNPRVLDVKADLLGDRQIEFLESWAGDWSGGIFFKSVISQTIFCTVATLPDSAQSDVVVSRLRVTAPGEYPENDIPTQDMDSNGWPRQGRDEALRAIRKAFAVHIAGDQHLATTVKYGIDDFGDASYAICVPSISNYFPRRWFPDKYGENRGPGQPVNTGDFRDGFGNKMTVLAVANPVTTGLRPPRLYDRAAGYGIIKFNKRTREIELSNWPRQTDPMVPGAKPYDGWPVKIKQEDNYSRRPVAWLPVLEIRGTELPPVVRITDEVSGELVYALRLNGNKFRPGVFASGRYRIEAGEPGTENWRVLNSVGSVNKADTTTIRITF
jgi:alkaline phosphatase D